MAPSLAAILRTSHCSVAESQKGAHLNRFVEIRAYNLHPGTRGRFHRLVVEQSVPMLYRWEVDVVAFGPSPHDEDSYFLIRAYASLEDRQRSQDAFYTSAEWRRGPRQSVVDCIASDTSVVIEMDLDTIDGLRRAGASAGSDRAHSAAIRSNRNARPVKCRGQTATRVATGMGACTATRGTAPGAADQSMRASGAGSPKKASRSAAMSSNASRASDSAAGN